MLVATKTLEAIEKAMYADQGASFRGHLGRLMPLAADAYSTKEDLWRDHLGASLIGRECSRELWYSFRWATEKRFDGRMLRLFNRGHLEEPRFIALLVMIGCQVWQVDANGKQFRIGDHNGHFGGSMDGVIQSLPDIPDQPVLGEFKTHNAKSFEKLVSEGVLKAKWEHFIQMQLYMGKNGLAWAAYCATNKDTDAIHIELVQFDPLQYQRYLDRAGMIIAATSPPPKINESPGWFKCKFCDQKEVCHNGAALAINCRTCHWSRVAEEGRWVCAADDYDLSKERQRTGCKSYEPLTNK